jgi:uncharacterized protein (TIGR01777 family)
VPAKKILITGGTGLIGNHLRKLLSEKNYDVSVLSRSAGNKKSFQWSIENNFIDLSAFQKTGTIIHLAGTPLADGRWTEKRKKEIIDSRVKSAALIFETLKANPHEIKTFISASAIGIYGDSGDEWMDETHPASSDFLGETCKQWEAATNRFSELGIRVVVIRIGIILSKDGGALPQMSQPIKILGGSPLGSGKQFMSWIHIDDLGRIFLKAIEDERMHGVYNAVAPHPVTNKEFIKLLTRTLHRPFFPIRVPAFILKWILGEKAKMVLNGQRVSSKKIQGTDFKFQFEKLEGALNDVYRRLEVGG